jgi:hypothetical protein
MKINNKFTIEDIVVLKTDPEQLPRVVVGVDVRKHGLLYVVACGDVTTIHFDFEMELMEKDEL